MPKWSEILKEVRGTNQVDVVRRKYTSQLSKYTGRNTIIYYSGWLQKQGPEFQNINFAIDDRDKNGFMCAIQGMDCTKGLDLILHTPGGSTAATESLVAYLHSKFKHIRAIVPHLAMSAGTMISLACNEILMGKHSSLGPIDPQLSGISAHGIIEEFEQAKSEIIQNPILINAWQPILSKYHPTLLGECQKAMDWSIDMTQKWLQGRMFAGDANASEKIQKIINELGNHSRSLSHSRQYSIEQIRDLKITVTPLEDDQKLQDLVLSVHHVVGFTLSDTPAYKIIENQSGVSYVEMARTFMVAQQQL